MKIKIADRTLCKEGNAFSFKEKIEVARQLEKLCVDVVELPQIENIKADTLLIKTISSFVKGNTISVATGITTEGVEGDPLEVGYTSGIKALFGRKKAKKAPRMRKILKYLRVFAFCMALLRTSVIFFSSVISYSPKVFLSP